MRPPVRTLVAEATQGEAEGAGEEAQALVEVGDAQRDVIQASAPAHDAAPRPMRGS